MEALDNSVINELQTLLQSANPDLVKSVWSGTAGDVMSTIKLLKQFVQDNKKTPTIHADNQKIRHSTSNPVDIGTNLTEFANIDDIQDPDLKFALQLQREEVEREQNLKKQQEEDSLFALRLQQEGDFQSNNLVSANSQVNQNTNSFVDTCTKLKKEEHSKTTIDDDDKTCVVCLDVDRNAVFAPCAHRICCLKCANQVFQAKNFCPLCWTNLEGVIECQKNAHK